MSLPEEKLWSVLDRWAVPIRSSREELVAKFGAGPATPGDRYQTCCVPACSNLEDKLAEPWHFYFGPSTPMFLVPGQWFRCTRKPTCVDDNLRLAVAGLKEILGEPTEKFYANTREMEWRFGHASVTAIFHPEELNSDLGPNLRHQQVPVSSYECLIIINDFWRETITAAEAADYRDAEVMWRESGDWLAKNPPCGVVRQLPEELQNANKTREFRFSRGSKTIYLQPYSDICWIVSTSNILSLEHVHLLPAKLDGVVWISAQFQFSAGGEVESHHLLCGASEDAEETLRIAQELARRLDVPLSTVEDYNC